MWFDEYESFLFFFQFNTKKDKEEIKHIDDVLPIRFNRVTTVHQ